MRTLKDYLAISLKGVAMGAADVVPGVSGGTIAFISGIYEELLDSIKSINFNSLKIIFSQGIGAFWKAINGWFFVSLLSGIGLSVFSLAKLIQYLLNNHPIVVWSFFFGLIIASAWFVGKTVEKWNVFTILGLLLGTIFAYLITIITPTEANEAYWFVFLSGAIAICAMILPGISGSFILVLLGMYKFVIQAVSDFNLLIILVFGSGALVGILGFSNILSWLLKKYKNQTIAVLAGFMIGSLNKVWPWKMVTLWGEDRHGEKIALLQENVSPFTYSHLAENQFAASNNNPQLFLAILLFFIGFLTIFIFEKFAQQKPESAKKM